MLSKKKTKTKKKRKKHPQAYLVYHRYTEPSLPYIYGEHTLRYLLPHQQKSRAEKRPKSGHILKQVLVSLLFLFYMQALPVKSRITYLPSKTLTIYLKGQFWSAHPTDAVWQKRTVKLNRHDRIRSVAVYERSCNFASCTNCGYTYPFNCLKTIIYVVRWEKRNTVLAVSIRLTFQSNKLTEPLVFQRGKVFWYSEN